MKVRNIALAAAAASALALGSAAFAQEDKKPDPAAKPKRASRTRRSIAPAAQGARPARHGPDVRDARRMPRRCEPPASEHRHS